ncbi:MAG: aldo/keto reductase [Bacteroidales bacterium]|jgi:aryl-alcohol dehydrogenase-like predicted oxidoreductase|nr:aldo/keto reductase [Bacteroidales bacterium]
MAKDISRRKFIAQGTAGLAAIGLLSSGTADRKPSLTPTRTLGKTGLTVPTICFGATRISEDSVLRYAIDNGLTFLDTGRAYANGNNEKMIGRVVSGFRDDVIIQSKIRLEPKDIPSGSDSRKGEGEILTVLSRRLEESLRALATDHIDILLYHDAAEESLLFHRTVTDFFSSKKAEGIIRAFGFSTHNDCLHLPERNNREGIYELMMLPFNYRGSYVHSINKTYSEWDQERLLSILQAAHEKNIGFIAMKTCSAGPYLKDDGAEASYPAAVTWVLDHDFVTSAAVAMANYSEIDDYLKAFSH